MAQSFRTSNRQSISFKMRMGARRLRTRILTALIQALEERTGAAA